MRLLALVFLPGCFFPPVGYTSSVAEDAALWCAAPAMRVRELEQRRTPELDDARASFLVCMHDALERLERGERRAP